MKDSKLAQVLEGYKPIPMKRLFYPRGMNLSEEFINAFHREYDRLIAEGINPKTLVERVSKAMKFHVNDTRKYKLLDEEQAKLEEGKSKHRGARGGTHRTDRPHTKAVRGAKRSEGKQTGKNIADVVNNPGEDTQKLGEGRKTSGSRTKAQRAPIKQQRKTAKQKAEEEARRIESDKNAAVEGPHGQDVQEAALPSDAERSRIAREKMKKKKYPYGKGSAGPATADSTLADWKAEDKKTKSESDDEKPMDPGMAMNPLNWSSRRKKR